MREDVGGGFQVAPSTLDDMEWAAKRIGIERWAMDSRGVTVWRGDERKAVAVYNMFSNHGCHLHFASDGRRMWASRGVLFALAAYPFMQLGLNRVTVTTKADNVRAIISCLKSGFEIEARTRKTAFDGSDEILLTLWRDKCRWLKEYRHGFQCSKV